MNKRIVGIIFVALVLCFTACATPDTAASTTAAPVDPTAAPSQVVTFADPMFEIMVRAAIGIPKDDISIADAEAVTELNLDIEWQPQIPPETQIQDISGIEYFKNLETLSLSFHNIKDISPLAGLTKLKSLSLGGNPVADVAPLSELTNLTDLTLFNCAASDYSALSKLVNLKFLMLDYSTISDVSALSSLPQLDYLSLSHTQVSDVAPLTGLTNLRRLFLVECPISDYSPLIAVYPNLEEKDFEMAASLRDLGFVAIGEHQQVESYKTETVIVQVHHADWGNQQNADEVNAVIMYINHGSDKELGVIYYPDSKQFLIFSNTKNFRYTYDFVTKTLNMEYGEENATAFLQEAYSNTNTQLELAPINDFDKIISDTFGVTANVLYLLPREVKVIDNSSLAALGFVAKEDNASYEFVQREPQYYSVEVRNPAWGSWDMGGDVRFFTTLSEGYRTVIFYFVDEQKYLVTADDDFGGGAHFEFYKDTKEHVDTWCSDPNKTVEEYFTAALNNPDIEDPYLYYLQLVDNYIKDTFGLTLDELYALPAEQ